MYRRNRALFCLLTLLMVSPAFADRLEIVLEEKAAPAQAAAPTAEQPDMAQSVPQTTYTTYLGQIVRNKARILAAPSTRASLYYQCPQGTYVALVGQTGNWYGVLMVDGRIGYIRKAYVRLTGGYTVGSAPQQPSPSNVGENIVQHAMRYLGIPYRWGGNTYRGLDCSGFVKAVYAAHGMALPRVSREQALVGAPVTWNELQAGDRLYFAVRSRQINHTGIYMGNGLFIHASSSQGKVGIDNLLSSKYYRSLVAARRSV
ncbi:MAG: C40 family peptidase [Armatimonadetes bacterium]|nr:C40 family peptidase [Armatimonadota bacterium]